MAKPATILIGIGHSFRGDDALGLLAVRTVNRPCPKHEHHGEGLGLIELWRDAARVIVIDAIKGGREIGQIIRIDATKERIPDLDYRSSSHVFGLAQAVELAREMKLLPKELIIYGMIGASFQIGSDLSYQVQAAIPELVRQVEAEIYSCFRSTETSCEIPLSAMVTP